MHYTVLIFVARWRHNFREIAVKNYEKSKNLRKSLLMSVIGVVMFFAIMTNFNVLNLF